jgi:hypothetical protein
MTRTEDTHRFRSFGSNLANPLSRILRVYKPECPVFLSLTLSQFSPECRLGNFAKGTVDIEHCKILYTSNSQEVVHGLCAVSSIYISSEKPSILFIACTQSYNGRNDRQWSFTKIQKLDKIRINPAFGWPDDDVRLAVFNQLRNFSKPVTLYHHKPGAKHGRVFPRV